MWESSQTLNLPSFIVIRARKQKQVLMVKLILIQKMWYFWYLTIKFYNNLQVLPFF